MSTHPECDDASIDLDLDALQALEEQQLTPGTPQTPGSSSESDLEIPSGQPDPPTPPPADQPPMQQVTMQQFAEDTSGRVQQLELEKTQLTQAHAELQARQDNLQATLEAIQRQLAPPTLIPNPDVRTRHHNARQPPTRAATQPSQSPPKPPPLAEARGRRVKPPPVSRVLTQPTVTGHAIGRPATQLPTFNLPAPPVHEQPMPMLPILPPVNQPHRQDFSYWTQPSTVSLPATLTELRTDRTLMDQAARTVSVNTQESSETGKPPKSGLKRDNAEHVQLVIPWPHEHVLRHNAKPPTYESLSLSEFAAGNMRILAANFTASPLIAHIASYLAELFDDTTDTDWPAARFAHRVVLQAMENGRIDYSHTHELRQMRRMALTRALRKPPTPTPATQSQRPRSWGNAATNSQPKRACVGYQKGDCTYPKNHQSAQGYLLHVCAYCLATVGRSYNHPESECRRKNGQGKETKNDEQGPDV